MNFNTIPTSSISEILPRELQQHYLELSLVDWEVNNGIYKFDILCVNLDDSRPWHLVLRWDSSRDINSHTENVLYGLGCNINGFAPLERQRQAVDAWLGANPTYAKVGVSPS